MSHTQFTHNERISLATLLRAGHIKADCARELSKDRSAVGREFDLNKDGDGVYRGAHAHKRAHGSQEKGKESNTKDRKQPQIATVYYPQAQEALVT